MNQLTSPWKNLSPMTKTRLRCAAAVLRGKLYAVGGYGGGLDSIEFYDFVEGRWKQAPSRMSQGRCCFAAASIGNSIFVAGGLHGLGCHLDSAEAFDVDSSLWRKLPSMSTKRWGCAAVAVGEMLFVFGGMDEFDTALNTAESFNLRTGRWEDLPPMINSRYHCAVAVIKNKIYVVGGHDERSELDTVEVFDLTTRTWTLLPHRMTTKLHSCAAAAVGNYLVVAGGFDRDTELNAVQMYDVNAERWTELSPMSTKRTGCAAISSGGSIFVMGGFGGRNLDSVEEIQFSDDIVKGMLVEWSEGSWKNEVAPILDYRTSVIHKLDIDIRFMPTLLSRIGQEEKFQTIFKIVRGEMGVFEHTCWRPNKKQKRR